MQMNVEMLKETNFVQQNQSTVPMNKRQRKEKKLQKVADFKREETSIIIINHKPVEKRDCDQRQSRCSGSQVKCDGKRNESDSTSVTRMSFSLCLWLIMKQNGCGYKNQKQTKLLINTFDHTLRGGKFD